MFCGNCGTKLNEGAKFCPSCGKPAGKEPAGKNCAQCGAPLKEGAVFCGNCGAKTAAAQSAEAMRPEPIIQPARPVQAAAQPESPPAPKLETAPLGEKKLCKQCGRELQDEWKTCPFCGANQAQTEALVPPQPQPPEPVVTPTAQASVSPQGAHNGVTAGGNNKNIDGRVIIVIAVGSIVTFLLRRFPPFGGYFSTAIIAALALIVGPVTGGAVGLLGLLITQISMDGFQPVSLLFVLLAGLYGFIIGKMFENKSIDPNPGNAIGDLGLFSLSVTGLNIVRRIIIDIIWVVIKNGQNLSVLFVVLSEMILSLITGAMSFVLAFIYFKCLKMKKR